MKLTEDEKEELQTADIFRPLLKIPGWRAYLALLEHHIANETALILKPVSEVALRGDSHLDKLVALESHKGAIIGLRLALTAVDNMILRADELRKRLNPEDEDE